METIDGLAFIGPNPGDDANVYIATGDSGMGMTHGTIAGLLLTDLILGRDNPWATLYDPGRKTLSAAKEFVRENLNVAKQYGEWLTPGDVRSVADIPACSGAVIRQGVSKLAVYKDGSGARTPSPRFVRTCNVSLPGTRRRRRGIAPATARASPVPAKSLSARPTRD